MTGSSVFDYIHHQDHNELAEQLGLGLSQGQNLPSPGSGSEESSSTAGTNNPDGKGNYHKYSYTYFLENNGDSHESTGVNIKMKINL